MKYLIKNGALVSSAGRCRADLLTQDGKIAQIGQGLSAEDAQVIDASGKYIFPGFIDTTPILTWTRGIFTQRTISPRGRKPPLPAEPRPSWILPPSKKAKR